MAMVVKFLLISVMIIILYSLGHIVRMLSHYNTHQYCGNYAMHMQSE